MTSHLSLADLNALVDGELSPEKLVIADEHLAGCPTCTASTLSQSLLKSATTRAGRRYALPQQLRERVLQQAQYAVVRKASERRGDGLARTSRIGRFGWVPAAAILLVAITVLILQRNAQQTQIATAESVALVTEVADQHIATLAASSPPQVISTDRHTVKPWFQGKLPFSFNLPEGLAADAKLDGANLTYIHNQPVAQLLYSIGKHHVSVYVTEARGFQWSKDLVSEHAGFHVMAVRSDDLEVIAVSDVEPYKLSDLLNTIGRSQAGTLREAK
jgi:anti-sigma factor RsiW